MNRNIWKEEQLIYTNKGVGGKLQQLDVVATTPPPTHSSKTLPLNRDFSSLTIHEFPSFPHWPSLQYIGKCRL